MDQFSGSRSRVIYLRQFLNYCFYVGDSGGLRHSLFAAVSFDYTGKIYAADGTSWKDTGQSFTAGEWYRVILKLNFDAHLYDIYIEPAAVPEVDRKSVV